jgi:pimeloyl-ACP methyl ester carboxylesterase
LPGPDGPLLATAQELPHEHAGRPQRRWGGTVPGYYARCPVLVVIGTLDGAGPRAESSAIVGTLPSGLGRLQMIEGAGDCPHDHYPDQVVAPMLAVRRSAAGA